MQFLVLGPLEVTVDGRAVALPAAKHRALLAVLLAHANQVVSAGGLIDALWDGHPPAIGRQDPADLRVPAPPRAGARRSGQRLADAADRGGRLPAVCRPGPAGRKPLRTAGRRRQAGAAPAGSGQRRGLAPGRAGAVARAYGELADAPFARAEAARLEELRLAALEWRAEAELALGGHAELVGELEQLVGREPFREQLWGHLMLALYRSGRQTEALRAYRRLRRQPRRPARHRPRPGAAPARGADPPPGRLARPGRAAGQTA